MQESHKTEVGQNNRKHIYRFDYFEFIDSQEKAYWLGFLMADGCVHKNRLILSLARRDRSHIVKFCESLGFINPPIFKVKTNGHLLDKVTLSCKEMVLNFKKHGLLERKTYKLDFPKLEKSLIRHFIRGYFDGDGGVTLSRNQTRCSISIVGVRKFLDKLKSYLNVTGGIYKTCSKVVDDLKFSAKGDIHSFYNYIYNGANIFLKRKKDRIEDFFKKELPCKKTSKYMGVGFDKSREKWYACIYKQNRRTYLGRFDTEDLAILAIKKYENSVKRGTRHI